MRILFLLVFVFISTHSFGENLAKINALQGKVSILAPTGFGPMSQNLLEMKYPSGGRPSDVLSDSTGGVTLAFNHTNNPMTPSQVKEAHGSISGMFHNTYPSAKWLRDEIVEQNGSVFMVLELITPAMDTEIHNIIYGTSVDGRFLMAAFNTTIQQSKEWLPIGKKIMSSLSVN